MLDDGGTSLCSGHLVLFSFFSAFITCLTFPAAAQDLCFCVHFTGGKNAQEEEDDDDDGGDEEEVGGGGERRREE